MDLSNLKPAEGATKRNRRKGRGVASGKGGHSSTRGDKGQKSRSGGKIPAGFEGGQMPLQRRLPKFGFNSPFRTEYQIVNVGRLAQLVKDERLDASEPITLDVLVENGIVGKRDRVKILGGGELNVNVTVTAHAFSKSAREKIEAAGGTVTIAE